ncbi:Elongation factor Tu mitochondrial, partial [Bienertia sinuspersici]
MTNLSPATSAHKQKQLVLHNNDATMFVKKLPKTTALRKGLWIGYNKSTTAQPQSTTTIVENEDGTNADDDSHLEESDRSSDEDFENNGSNESNDSDNEGSFVTETDLHPDERGGDLSLVSIEDNWQPHMWHDFMDNDDDDDYFGKLYRNGELYEEKEFGKIELKPWMNNRKEPLQRHFEGLLCARGYTAICAAECCGWRIHASRLADGRTWAIKKINPNFHTCRGLETYNPICDVKWAGKKLMEKIRSNPDIPGKELNGELFKKYGLHMKLSTLYKMKNHVITELFGGHDKSYGFLPSY